MPIICEIRKRSWSLRAQVFFIYVILTLGSITMVYPFLVMTAGSFKSRVDSQTFDVVPQYFYDDGMLYKKYEEARYNEDMILFNSCTGAGAAAFKDLQPPKHPHPSPLPAGEGTGNPLSRRAGKGGVRERPPLVEEWKNFLGQAMLPMSFYQLGQTETVGAGFMPIVRRKYMMAASDKFHGDLAAYNRTFESTATAWFYVYPLRERFIDKRYVANDDEASRFFRSFKLSVDEWQRVYQPVAAQYRYNFLSLKYGATVDKYNAKRGTNYKSYNDITLSRTVPTGRDRDDWIEFVRDNLNAVFIVIDKSALPQYRSLLKKKYEGNIDMLNRAYRTNYRSFDEVRIPTRRDVVSRALVDYGLFVKAGAPEFLRIDGPDFRFQDYLAGKYGSIAKLNQKLGAHYASFSQVDAPILEADWDTLQEHKGEIRWEFITRNYSMVLNFLLLHGRGIFNTAVFCTLCVVIALTFNPVAAYAMSRYNLPSTFKILLFMMATMAFPSAVTMIPNFLLLKQLHMLNTFWALVLPGVASGYSIFLLKGFFDSLPKELYEAGMIDGASEWTMFWKITMSLSKPILAVLALGAFTGAYGTFMYAFTVCQDQSMWTLMVWLFKLQSAAHTSVVYAALIVAAIPTLIVFVISQDVIMRGIIVPQEK